MSDLNEAATDVHEPHLLRFGGLLANYSSDKKHRFRAMLAVKQGMKCCYCCKPVTLQFPSKKKVPLDFATFEHLEDVFSGNGPKNDSTSAVAIACRQCNENRGRMRSKWAFQYYGSFFTKSTTLQKFLQHPKVGWVAIVREFGPLPPPDSSFIPRDLLK